MILRGNGGLPFRFHNRCAVFFSDDRRAANGLPNGQCIARKNGCAVFCAAGMHVGECDGLSGTGSARRNVFRWRVAGTDGFHRHCFRHQRAAWHQETEPPAVIRFKCCLHLVSRRELNHQCRVGTLIAQMHTTQHPHPRCGNALRLNVSARNGCNFIERFGYAHKIFFA